MIIFASRTKFELYERNISYDFGSRNAENTFFNLTNFTICMSFWYIDAFYDSVLWLWLDM